MTVPAEETEPRPGARAALHLLYPPTCIACGGATAAPHGLCARCWGGLSLIERPFCERLGKPFAVDLGMPLLSPAAIANPPVFERARALARFDETAQALLHRLKYGDRIELARALGATMARAGAELTRDADVIVPVPLHSWRLWRRRFNQAMALVRVVSEASGVPMDPFLLARVKPTRPQIGLTGRSGRTTSRARSAFLPKRRAAFTAGARSSWTTCSPPAPPPTPPPGRCCAAGQARATFSPSRGL